MMVQMAVAIEHRLKILAGGVNGGVAALDAVDLVAVLQHKFDEVGAVLPGDASDECFFSTTSI